MGGSKNQTSLNRELWLETIIPSSAVFPLAPTRLTFPCSWFASTVLRADATLSGSISVATKFQPYDAAPSNGKMQDAPVPLERRAAYSKHTRMDKAMTAQ